jgi:hypothetical protein
MGDCPVCLEPNSEQPALCACTGSMAPMHRTCFWQWTEANPHRDTRCPVCASPICAGNQLSDLILPANHIYSGAWVNTLAMSIIFDGLVVTECGSFVWKIVGVVSMSLTICLVGSNVITPGLYIDPCPDLISRGDVREFVALHTMLREVITTQHVADAIMIMIAIIAAVVGVWHTFGSWMRAEGERVNRIAAVLAVMVVVVVAPLTALALTIRAGICFATYVATWKLRWLDDDRPRDRG